ncbi:MAG: TetR family transcriptional regulator [Sulfuricella sp.]|nr:TetR family transcriptional regulator [Sulfuricella sp.]
MARRPATEEARLSRRNALLDAAVSLWLNNPDGIASVAEVARAAKVGKGTIYLYFASKEDLLLAAHERHAEAFFTALYERAWEDKPMTHDDMMRLTHQYIVEVPAYLPLATLVGGLLHKSVTPEVAAAFEKRLAERLQLAGGMLCRHFPFSDDVAGARLLMQSYGLILGLWQLLGNQGCVRPGGELANLMQPDYFTELDAALRALWRGVLEPKEPSHA